MKDPIFDTLEEHTRPIPWSPSGEFPRSVRLRQWRSDFVALKKGEMMERKGVAKAGKGSKKQKKKMKKKVDRESSMTKKEKKKVASNWGKMKASLNK